MKKLSVHLKPATLADNTGLVEASGRSSRAPSQAMPAPSKRPRQRAARERVNDVEQPDPVFQVTPEILLTVADVARRLNVSEDWVRDHSSRKSPHLPVIRMSSGVLRYRPSRLDRFVDERERLSAVRQRRRSK